MLHPPGSRLGPYEIVSPIGAGGMGDVYKARDTRLERTVAVKVAKEPFGERFRNEALAVAALNHPHVGTLFDVGPDYLVMEYVEGKALRGPLPAADVLRLAGQVADALEHAHRHGVVHRDLKPSNILLTKSGVKVLDFGLAKRRPAAPARESQPTLTEEGSVVGTPRYMAPELIDGNPADERSDIFAFGLVLYEMLTGRHAFEGKSAASVMAGILEREPTPISALVPATPPALEEVVLTCLAKDPAERWQSVRELKHALAWAARPAAPSGTRRRGSIRAAAAAAVVLAVVAGAGWALRGTAKPTRPPPVRLSVALPPTAEMSGMATAAISPDGRHLALVLSLPDRPLQLFVRPLDALVPTAVPGGESGYGPFWSPDSRHIALWGPWGLRSVDLDGGPPRLVCRECRTSGGGKDNGATWSTTGVIVFSDLGRLFQVPAEGGEPEPLGALVPGETGRFWPQFLPDGRHYLYLSLASRREDQAIYVGALGSDLRQRVVAAQYAAAFAPPGHLLYVKDDDLVAHKFDAERLTLSGAPFPILDEEVARFAGTVLAGQAQFSVSANGVLAWRPGPMAESRRLTWFDRSGRKQGTIGEPGRYVSHALSPDEKSVAACRWESASNRDIWILDAASGASRRLTFDPHDDCNPVWSPDGTRVAFFSDRRGVREIYERRVDGSFDDEILLASEDFALNLESRSADGHFLSYNSARPGRSVDLFLLPLSRPGGAGPVPFLATPLLENFSALSPNGRFLAYHSDESGKGELYVREVAPSGQPGPGKWQISNGAAALYPRWRPDGRELFYFDKAGLLAASVQTDGSRFRHGAPRPLGVRRGEQVPTSFGLWSVSRDGQRFLLGTAEQPPEPFRILVNWLPPGR